MNLYLQWLKRCFCQLHREEEGLYLLLYLCNKAISEWYICGPIILTKFLLLFTLLTGALKHCWKSSEHDKDGKFWKKESISSDTHENAIFLLGLSSRAGDFSVLLCINSSAIWHMHRCRTGLELSDSVLKNVCFYYRITFCT